MSLKLLAPKWSEIQKNCLEIAQKCRSDEFEPDVIVGVARGGWIPARLLADFLGVERLTNLGISFYSDIATTVKRPRITQAISENIKGKLVLMVDDVSDTGHSLKLGRDHLLQRYPSKLKIATIFKKPWTILTPDYFTSETDAWIIFPWEHAESTRSLRKRLSAEGLSSREIKRKLVEAGLSRAIIKAAGV